ncbi:MAG: protein-disulfide reductase DsbD, partial [Pseudomonadales bacterium]|nr:protein-disulfide reductase DsbD [Pseudomonadales bacterium]
MFSIGFDKIKTSLVLFVTLMLVTSVNAGIFSKAKVTDPRPVEEVFVLHTEALADNQLLLRWDVLPDYYLYDQRMKFSADDGVTITQISRSETQAKDDPLFGKVQVYYHSSEIVLQLANLGGRQQVNLKIDYQGCWDGGVCYPPVTEQRAVTLIAAPVIDNIAASSTGKTTLSGVSNAPDTAIQGLASEHDYFSQLLSKGNLVWILSAFFVAGLALSLTPCVFPMIPILSSIIAGQGESITKSKALLLTSIYILAVSFTYTAAGVLAGIFGENLQALFQATWIIILFSAIFVILALSMFGFYQLQLPAALQSKLTKVSNGQKGGSFIGVAVMGVLSALIVGPCMAAPLAGALIYIGQSADPVLGGLALFSLSIGMGVPLLIVGVSAGHFMPKAGPWMDGVKASFGVLLIFMAIYMLDRIVPLQVTMLLTAATLIVSAIYLGALSSLQSKAA